LIKTSYLSFSGAIWLSLFEANHYWDFLYFEIFQFLAHVIIVKFLKFIYNELFCRFLFYSKRNKIKMHGRRPERQDREQESLTRIAIVNSDRCKPKKCNQECKRSWFVIEIYWFYFILIEIFIF